MKTISDSQFERFVLDGLAQIPDRFKRKLRNVAIVIEDEPTKEQCKKLKLHKGSTLFGLYEGIPQTERGSGYVWVLPDKITIFKKPIKEAAATAEDVRTIVIDTVWHEIAHHFGYRDREISLREHGRRRNR